ncbi:ABC transporter ATP-binding protein [Lentzea flava]|uniref:Dipeptide/oligopeptide/nickel ABC transporter ATP-binding protein n=1 Tax=Lentzea flava TaxID=103732 RepID=A0ABQ2UMG9_9PSEU|nr:ABC transporter ATP-binding protein [Lentzea flava]MCP2200348.1 peptide/nickel transport system ATP-binding protein [Lentzea flava]GGU41680.1 dipeptide/oligopeptide/nickel ABC transporter ATP-binding protein [Lentzea flava]
MNEVALEAKGLVKTYKRVRAVQDVSLVLRRGRVTALVGESGSGKSTVAKLLARLVQPTEGEILLDGRKVRQVREYRRKVQMVFQDPFASLNPIHTIRYHLTRPLKIHKRPETPEELMERVQLPADFLSRYPHELSGGQRQRVAIARALAAHPEVLLADEPVSMLDVSIRLGVLNLLLDLKERLKLAVLYITHDIASARYFADETFVMYGGQIVEGGDSESVTQQPAHPYTQLLIESAPDPERSVVALDAPVEEVAAVSAGCQFAARCPKAQARCWTDAPPRSDVGDGHWAACWLYVETVGSAA